MAQPFYMQCTLTYEGGLRYEDCCSRFVHVYELIRDIRNGLYYHAYDDSRRTFWCDKATDLPDNF